YVPSQNRKRSKRRCLRKHRASYGEANFRLTPAAINQQDTYRYAKDVSTESDGGLDRFGPMSEPDVEAKQHCIACHVCRENMINNMADGVHTSRRPRKQEY